MVDKKLTPEEIVALRDDVPANRQVRRALHQDPEALLALADARLLAVALALTQYPDTGATSPPPSDEDLAAYLLNAMPAQRRRELEAGIRGSALALSRLLRLRQALLWGTEDSGSDLPAHWPMQTAREDMGTVLFRKRDRRLEFRYLDTKGPFASWLANIHDEPGPRFEEAPPLANIANANIAAGDISESAFAPPNPERSKRLVDEIRQLAAAADRLSELLEARAQAITKVDSDTAAAPSFADIHTLIDQIITEIQDSGREFSDQLSFTLHKQLPFLQHAWRRPGQSILHARSFLRVEREREPRAPLLQVWNSSVSVEGSEVHATIQGKDESHLMLILRKSNGSTWVDSLVTIVVPGRGFDSATTDEAGKCFLPLGTGSCVLLIEAGSSHKLKLEPRSE